MSTRILGDLARDVGVDHSTCGHRLSDEEPSAVVFIRGLGGVINDTTPVRRDATLFLSACFHAGKAYGYSLPRCYLNDPK